MYHMILLSLLLSGALSCSADFSGEGGLFSGGSKKDGPGSAASGGSNGPTTPCEDGDTFNCQGSASIMNGITDAWNDVKGVGGSSRGSEIQFSDGTTLVQRCSTAKAKTETFNLSFPKTHGRSCDWNTGDNLGPIYSDNTTVKAMRAQVQTIKMPKDALLCSISLESKTAEIRYDDYMIFTFDDFLMSASQHTESEFVKAGMSIEDGLIAFEGAKVIDSFPTSVAVNNRPTPGYCSNGGTCVLPPSDKAGAVKFAIPETWFAQMPVKTLLRSEHQFQVLVTGQGYDPLSLKSDCGHSGFEMAAKVTYILPE